jgi:hypothetical protein
MKFDISARYQTAVDFGQRAKEFQLPVEVWTVAAEIAESDSTLSVDDLENLTGLSPTGIREAINYLLSENLVLSHTVSWQEFSDARAKTPLSERRPAAKRESTPRSPSQIQQGVESSLGNNPSVSAIANSKTPEATPLVWADIATAGGYRLKTIMEKIGILRGGGVEGDFLVYQVFVRVPYQLLHKEGIRSLDLVNNNTMIQNEELYLAIVKATKEVTGVQI